MLLLAPCEQQKPSCLSSVGSALRLERGCDRLALDQQVGSMALGGYPIDVHRYFKHFLQYVHER
jgi:hypothetical protein